MDVSDDFEFGVPYMGSSCYDKISTRYRYIEHVEHSNCFISRAFPQATYLWRS